MAWVYKEKVKEIRGLLKEKFPKFKFLVSGTNTPTLKVVIKSGPVRFSQSDHSNLNPYHPENYENGGILRDIINVCKIGNWDNSRSEEDYFDVGWYVSIRQGDYGKPYIVTI